MLCYEPVYRALGLDDALIDIALGRLALPDVFPTAFSLVHQPAENYGFPPVFIPLWSQPEYPTYFGIWKHWFTQRRQLSYVEHELEMGFPPTEIARSVHQFMAYLVFRELEPFGGESDPLFTSSGSPTEAPVAQFARQHCVETFDEVMRVATEAEFERTDVLLSLSTFQTNAPLVCFPGGHGYRGDFPHEGMPFDEATLRNSCSLEYDDLTHQMMITAATRLPPWLSERRWGRPKHWWSSAPVEQVFDAQVDQGDFLGAWMTINSCCWTGFVETALERLADESKYQPFQFLVDAWLKAKSTFPADQY